MFHKGITKELIIATAVGMIEEGGFKRFSMRKLAESLGVKTASLYAHIESMDALFTEIGLYALNAQRNALLSAMDNCSGDEAVLALSGAYRSFAFEHGELYDLIMQMPIGKDETLKEAASITADTFMRALCEYNIPAERKMHWQRVLRGTMHGFVSSEKFGYFSHYPVSAAESYSIAINAIIDALHKEEDIIHG